MALAGAGALVVAAAAGAAWYVSASRTQMAGRSTWGPSPPASTATR